MAVTNEDTTQLTNSETEPVTHATNDVIGNNDSVTFDHTQGAAAGDANSTIDIWKFAGGRVRIKSLDFAVSAYGASRVLKFGHRAYIDVNGDTVAEDDNAYASSLDVSAAADILDLVNVLTESRDGFTIYATVTGGTIPAAATTAGFINYIREAT